MEAVGWEGMSRHRTLPRGCEALQMVWGWEVLEASLLSSLTYNMKYTTIPQTTSPPKYLDKTS